MAESLTFTKIVNVNNTQQDPLQNDSNKIALVFIHGWGLNSGVWQPLVEQFINDEENSISAELDLITLDLPGFGKNSHINITPYSLENICQYIAKVIDQPAIYLGWSLGGLIATTMALNHPEKVLGLITVASSPHFVENNDKSTFDKNINNSFWPGIKENVLESFHHQLSKDIEKTLSNFLKIQAMGSPHIRQDLKRITQLVMQRQLPNEQTLTDSLQLLSSSDLRQQLAEIKQPFLRLYGANDSLVPKSIIPLVDQLAEKSEHRLFTGASHAPFISHADDFYKVLNIWLTKAFMHK
jgi:pimeloyl-[acyl-carrier protein] methyl ester esterase